MPVDDAADHRALPGDGRRLEGGGLGCGVDRDRDGGVLSVRQGGGTGERQQARSRRVRTARGRRSTSRSRRPCVRSSTAGSRLEPDYCGSHVARGACSRGASARRCLVASAQSPQPPPTRQKTRTFHSADEFARATGGKVRDRAQLDPTQRGGAASALTQLPSDRVHRHQRPVAVGHLDRHARRAPSVSAATIRRASTSPACAGCPTITSPASASTATATWIETPQGLRAHRVRADDARRASRASSSTAFRRGTTAGA